MDKEKCGKYIREKREALGLTKEELAEKLNVGAYDVDCWEAGFFPSAEFLLPLSDALHIDVEELLSGEDLCGKKLRRARFSVLRFRAVISCAVRG